MSRTTSVAVALILCTFSFVLYSSFTQSLPYWCSHPQGDGNWIVQPLCSNL